jgi:hypothetical protein
MNPLKMGVIYMYYNRRKKENGLAIDINKPKQYMAR